MHIKGHIMNEKEIVSKFNDLLVEKISSYVEKEIDEKILAQSCEVIVLCTGVFGKVGEIIDLFSRYNPEARLVIVGKRSFEGMIKERAVNPYILIDWEQRFNVNVIDRIEEAVSIKGVDSIIFASKAAIDLRDMNILQIILRFPQLKTFSYTAGEELNYYYDVSKYYKSLICYNTLVEWINAVVLAKTGDEDGREDVE